MSDAKPTHVELETRLAKAEAELVAVRQQQQQRECLDAARAAAVESARQAEEGVRESEAKFRNLFENIEELVTVYEVERDGGGRIVERRLREANPAFLRAVGVSSADQIRGKTSSEIFGKVWSESHLPAVQKAMDTGEVQVQEVYRPDSGQHYLTSVVRLDADHYLLTGRGITELKRAEEALRQSEDRYRGVVEKTTAIILRTAPSGVITFANRRALNFFGYSAEELIGKHAVGTVVPPQESSGRDLAKMVDQIAADPDAFQTNANENMCKDGRRVWLEWTNSGIYGPDGKLQEFLSVGIDATAHKQAEEALRESEQEYRRLYDSMRDAFVIVGMDGRIQDCNAAYSQMLGYSDEELRRLTYEDLTPAKWHAMEARIVAEDIIPKGSSEIYEKEWRRKDGTVLSVELRRHLIRDENGQPVQMSAIVRDITDRKRAEETLRQSEERYRTLFESMTEGFALHEIVTDEQGRPVDYRFLDVNPAFERLTGLKRADVLDKRVLEVLPGIEAHWTESYGRVALTGEPVHFENFSASLDRWYEVFAYRSAPRQFAVVFTDITTRKQAEEALVAAHKQTQRIIDNMPAIVYALDLEQRFVMANAALVGLLNSTPEQMIGKRRHEFMPKEDADWHEANDRQVIEAGTALEFEEYSKLQGRSITWLTTKFPLRDVQGRIYAVAGFSAEITQRKQMEEALRELNATLENKVAERTAEVVQANAYNRRLIEASLDPLVTIGPDGKITDVNAATQAATGLTREQLVGTDFCDYFTDPAKARAGYEQVFRKGAVRDYGLELRHRDGRAMSVLYHGTIYRDEQGKVAGVFAAARDVTDRLRSEVAVKTERQRLYGVLEALPAMVCLLTPDCHVPFANRSFRERFGEPNGRCCYEFCFGRDKPCDFCQTYKVLETGQPHHWEFNAADGSVIDAHDFPFTDVDGSPMILEMDMDITETREAQTALRQANEQLAGRATQLRALAGELTLSEQRERRRMARLLHDQLQQLLVGCKFQLAVLGRHEDSVVQKATGEAIGLLDDAIGAARSLTAELSPPILHEASLVEGLQWLARWMAEKHGLFVDLSMAEDPPPLAEDVKVLLFESARELLFNVVKHAQAKSATVNLRQIKGGTIQLAVADQGVGFEADKVRPGTDGGGFGLFSIRERLELIGGQMEVRSTPGQGSLFVLTAPMREAPAEPAPAPLRAAEPGDGQAVQAVPPLAGAKVRVLLADDHAVMRQGLTQLLGQEADIEVIGGAADGREAVQLAGELSPDVILMDANMPHLNGVEATRAIHNDYPDIRIIGLSMFEEADRAQAMRDAGAVDYLTKTGPGEQLIAAIRRACQPARASELAPGLSEPPKTPKRSHGKRPRTPRPRGQQSST